MKIYGPVPSWRLGNSLGVDLVDAPPGYSKACPFNCLYCHLGHKGTRMSEPVQVDLPTKDFDNLFAKIDETKPDYITFSGQGEPTLNLNLGQAAKRIKEMCNIPIAVLTNACFAPRKDVRAGLDMCDVVIAKIDAPTQDLFEKINQPAKGIRLADIIGGIKSINTKVCIQTLVFSCANTTNADDDTIGALMDVYRDINKSRPIEVLLGTVTRPSDDENLRPVDSKKLSGIAERISEECGIKARYFSEKEQKKVNRNISQDKLAAEMTDLLLRRPCTREEIISRFDGSDPAVVLDKLIGRGVLGLKVLDKKDYYVVL